MSDNESYDLAVEYVVRKIHELVHEWWDELIVSTSVDVDGLQDCDCIPLDVTDRRGNRWQLQSSKRWHVTKMLATYEVRP